MTGISILGIHTIQTKLKTILPFLNLIQMSSRLSKRQRQNREYHRIQTKLKTIFAFLKCYSYVFVSIKTSKTKSRISSDSNKTKKQWPAPQFWENTWHDSDGLKLKIDSKLKRHLNVICLKQTSWWLESETSIRFFISICIESLIWCLNWIWSENNHI